MSLIFFDGFETESVLSIKELTISLDTNALCTVVTDYKRTGSRSMQLRGGDSTTRHGYAGKVFTTDSTSLVCGFAVRFYTALPASDQLIFQIGRKDGSRYIRVYLDSTGHIFAKDEGILGSNTTLGISSVILGINTLYYIQAKLIAHTVNGRFSLIIGNQTQISTPGINLGTGTGNVVDKVQLHAYNNTLGMYLDDIYIVDSTAPNNDFIGVCSIYGSFATGNGDRMDFDVFGADTPAECVDEVASNSSDYIYADTLNDKALFVFSDITTTGEIKAIFVHDYSARSEEGQGASKYKFVLRDATDQELTSDEISVSTAVWGAHLNLLENNPITDTTLDLTSLNDMQFGVIITQVD